MFHRGFLLMLAASSIITLFPPRMYAQEQYRLGEVVVSAEQHDGPTSGSADATGFATVIQVDELPSQVTSLPEVLDQAVGVTVKQHGGLGSFSTISIRGSSSEQVVIYLDGILLNKAVSGVVDLADIPLDSLEKIEIYRGTSPARFGGSGIGGVVNLVTRSAKKPLSVRAGYSFGSFETHKANLYLAGSTDSLTGTLIYNRLQSDGDFEFKDDRGTAYNRSDDRRTHRRNNTLTADNLIAKGSYAFPGGLVLSAHTDIFKKHRGVPGIGSYQSRQARLRTFRSLSQVRMTKRNAFTPGLDVELSCSYSYQRQKFRDLKDEIGLGRQNNTDDTKNSTVRLLVSYMPGEIHSFTLLGEISRETYESRDKLASLSEPDSGSTISWMYGFVENARDNNRRITRTDEQKRYSYTMSLEDEIYLFNDRLLISPSAKINYYQNDFKGAVPFSSVPIAPEADTAETHLTRKLGMAFFITDGLKLKANIGKYYRIPNFYELFGDRGAVVGNTDLEPEDGLVWDVGLTFTGRPFPSIIKSCTLEYSYFYNDVDDLIIFIQNSQRTSIAQNISSAQVKGHEFFWRIRFCRPILISGNLTIQDTRDRSRTAYWRNNRLPGRPKYELFNRVEVFSEHFRLFHEIEFIDESWLDRANIKKIDRRTFQNAGISWSPVKQIVFTFEVKNITDRHSEDVIGYPLPGRTFFGTLDVFY